MAVHLNLGQAVWGWTSAVVHICTYARYSLLLHFVVQARYWGNTSTGGRHWVQTGRVADIRGLSSSSHCLRTVMLFKINGWFRKIAVMILNFNGWFRKIALVKLMVFIFRINCFCKIYSHFTQINSQDAMTK